MNLRPYARADREACLKLFDRHVPGSFAPQERAAFEQFLDQQPSAYFVVEREGTILACGGHVRERIRWLIVHREHQGRFLGRWLLLFLLREIGRQGHRQSTLATTLEMAGFYERMGYRVIERIPDGYAPSYDRVEMVKKLEVCA